MIDVLEHICGVWKELDGNLSRVVVFYHKLMVFGFLYHVLARMWVFWKGNKSREEEEWFWILCSNFGRSKKARSVADFVGVISDFFINFLS